MPAELLVPFSNSLFSLTDPIYLPIVSISRPGLLFDTSPVPNHSLRSNYRHLEFRGKMRSLFIINLFPNFLFVVLWVFLLGRIRRFGQGWYLENSYKIMYIS